LILFTCFDAASFGSLKAASLHSTVRAPVCRCSSTWFDLDYSLLGHAVVFTCLPVTVAGKSHTVSW